MTCTIVSDGKELDAKCQNENEGEYLQIKKNLRDTIWSLYCEGYTEFCVNCEYGVPLWAAEIVCALKRYNKIFLTVVAPYEEQCRDWSEERRDRYYSVHEMSDECIFASAAFTPDCRSAADEIMIGKSDLLMIYGDPSSLYAEKYAKQIGVSAEKISY